MADRISDVLQELISAIQTVNDIVDQDVPPKVSKNALGKMRTALAKIVDHNDLWVQLGRSARGKPSLACVPEPEQFLEGLATLLGDAYEELLQKWGYRSPPPPLLSDLIEKTRSAVRGQHAESRWGSKHVEVARNALTEFVLEVDQHMKDPATLHPRLPRLRRTAIAAAFLAILSQAEVRTGDKFSVDLSASVAHPITFKITVPVPWGTASRMLSQSVNSIFARTGVVELAQTMDLDLGRPPDAPPVPGPPPSPLPPPPPAPGPPPHPTGPKFRQTPPGANPGRVPDPDAPDTIYRAPGIKGL